MKERFKSTPKIVQMTSERREIMMRVIDGVYANVAIVYQLSRYTDCDKLCLWIIRHGYAGKNLVPWIKGQFCNSILSMVQWIVAKNNRENLKPVLLGRDWN